MSTRSFGEMYVCQTRASDNDSVELSRLAAKCADAVIG